MGSGLCGKAMANPKSKISRKLITQLRINLDLSILLFTPIAILEEVSAECRSSLFEHGRVMSTGQEKGDWHDDMGLCSGETI